MTKPFVLTLLMTLLCLSGFAHAQDAAPATQPSILKNGDFSADSDGDGVPDGWPAKVPDGSSWTKEDGKIILKLVTTEAGKNNMVYQRMQLEAGHPKVMQLKTKVRYADVKPGKSAWFDARILLGWKDKDDKGVKHDWRADITNALAKRQLPDGSWKNENDRWMEGDPNLVTGYALMALSYCKPK